MPSDLDAIVESLAAWRGRHLRRAWRPILVTENSSWQTVESQYGGAPLLKADEAWPSCSDCGRPMKLLIQLDMTHLPHGLHPISSGLLQYFQCWPEIGGSQSCRAGMESFAPFSKGKLVRIMERKDAEPARVPRGLGLFPLRQVARWGAFWDLPSTAEHESLGLVYDYQFKPGVTATTVSWPAGGVAASEPVVQANDNAGGLAEAIATAAEGDKIGGWPFWVQGVEYPHCPACGTEMHYLLQIDSHDNIPDMFGDAGTGHVTFCPLHPETLTFAWACY